MPWRRRGRNPIVSAELPVGLLRHVGRVREELARRLGVELRIGPQEVEELRHGSGEVRLLLGGLHLRLDACDLFQADVVDLLRRQVQRGELLDHRLVVSRRRRASRSPRASCAPWADTRSRIIVSSFAYAGATTSRSTVAASARIAAWSAAGIVAGICVNGAYSGLVVSPFTYGSIVLSRPTTDTRGTL